MSFSRSKYEHLLTIGLPMFIAILGLPLVLIGGRYKGEGLLILFCIFLVAQFLGLAFIFLSKLSNIEKGEYFNFGFKGMERRERFLYVIGYTILISTTIFEIKFAIQHGFF